MKFYQGVESAVGLILDLLNLLLTSLWIPPHVLRDDRTLFWGCTSFRPPSSQQAWVMPSLGLPRCSDPLLGTRCREKKKKIYIYISMAMDFGEMQTPFQKLSKMETEGNHRLGKGEMSRMWLSPLWKWNSERKRPHAKTRLVFVL